MSLSKTMFLALGLILAAAVVLPVLTDRDVVIAQATAAEGEGSEGHAFVGSKSCRKCHSATYKSWQDLRHGKAFETLKPGVAAEAKAKANLDPNKDYTKDETCLACHTTGFGQEGGYFIPDESDKKAVRKAAKLEGVGCESCHGAGGAYNEVFSEIMKSKRKYKVEELTAVGLEVITEQTCQKCHNEDNPTFDASKPFDFEEMKKTGVHEHVELKQREG